MSDKRDRPPDVPTNAAWVPGPVATALRAVIERAAALPDGEAERYVRTCTRALSASCMHRVDVREAVDRLVAAVIQLQGALNEGPRRRAQHDSRAVERLLEALQEELLPELRRQGLV